MKHPVDSYDGALGLTCGVLSINRFKLKNMKLRRKELIRELKYLRTQIKHIERAIRSKDNNAVVNKLTEVLEFSLHLINDRELKRKTNV